MLDTGTTPLGAAVISGTGQSPSANDVTSCRAVSEHRAMADNLGARQDRPGFWRATASA